MGLCVCQSLDRLGGKFRATGKNGKARIRAREHPFIENQLNRAFMGEPPVAGGA